MRPKSELRSKQQAVITELYQEDAIRAILPMGEGKTICALTAIQELQRDGHIRCALVLAPKKVAQLVWPKEPGEWEHTSGMRVVHVGGSPQQRVQKLLHTDADVYVVGIDNTQWLCDVLKVLPRDHKLLDLLCIDEGSRFKNPRGKRAKALFKLADRWKARWDLSGTPRPNGYEDLFMPLSIVTAGRLWGRSFDKWRQANFMPVDYNGYNWTIAPWRRQEIIDAAASVSITVELTETLGMTPVFHWLDLPPAAALQYKEMAKKLVTAAWDEGRQTWVSAANHAVASGKLSQLAQGFLYNTPDGAEGPSDRETLFVHDEKTAYLEEMLDGLDENALIAYGFGEDLIRIETIVGHDKRLGAGVSDRKTAQYEADWNAGLISRLPIHPASAAHGLNLQYGGRQLIVYCMPWSPEQYAQLLKRIDRPGQKEHCYAHHILVRGTVDEVKYDRVINHMSEEEAFRKYLRSMK